ncbi:MAG: tRNA (adenosine(37)-N6)-threonylcarbamoyltransferase complex transferase subunit TsaD [Patescibacteria group bacterium]
MLILGVETSCDETALAVIRAEGGFKNPRFAVCKNLIASQIKIHAPFGGVVPNLAKRAHEKNLPILLKKLQTRNSQLKNVDVIAVVVGPGLEPCLWQGITFAEKLAQKYKKPIIAINHMEGHIFSVLLNGKKFSISNFQFPMLALLVSGGHTELVLAKNWLDYRIVGETLDDAAGEAFDKVARLLGLAYPGGPALSKLASSRDRVSGKIRDSAIKFPRPMINSKDLNFSFSGLKTAVLYAFRKNPKLNKILAAKEFEEAVVDVLAAKTAKAIQKYKPKILIVAGGVSANKKLRQKLNKTLSNSAKIFFPEQKFTGDNAAMIAAAGYFHAVRKDFTDPRKLKAEGRLSIASKKR